MAAHLSPELLASVLRGDLPPSTLVTLVHHHLGELCPECRHALEVARQGGREMRRLSQRPAEAESHEADGYHGAFEKAACRALDEAERLQDAEGAAQRDLEELLSLDGEERRERVRRAHSRFRGRGLAERLLVASSNRVKASPVEARELAELVDEVLVQTPGALLQPWGEVLAARAQAHRANALRVAGDLLGSERVFQRLRSRLARFPVDDVEAHAEICSLEASLRQSQRRTEEAEVLLERAILLYRQARHDAGVARTLVQKGTLLVIAEEPLAALDCLEEAERVVRREEDGELYRLILVNRLVCLCDLERFEEAAALLDGYQDVLAGTGDAWFDVRLTWTRGLVAHGLGSADQGEGLLLEARDSFLAQGNDFNAALVSLDLAVIYLEQGRWAELQELALGMGTAFEARQLLQHELSALILFQQAVAQQRITAEGLRNLRNHLQGPRDEVAARQRAPVS